MEDSTGVIKQGKKLLKHVETELLKENVSLPKSLLAFLIDYYVNVIKVPNDKLKIVISTYIQCNNEDANNVLVYIDSQKRMLKAYEDKNNSEKNQADKEDFLRNKIISLEPYDNLYRSEVDKTAIEFYNTVAEYLWFKKSKYSANKAADKQLEVDRIILFVKYIIPVESVRNVMSLSIVNKVEQIESLFLLYIGTELLKTLNQSQSINQMIDGNTVTSSTKNTANLLPVADMHDIIYKNEFKYFLDEQDGILLRNRATNIEFNQKVKNALIHQAIVEFKQIIEPFIDELVTLTNNITTAIKKTFEYLTKNPKALKKDIYPMVKDLALYYINIFVMYNKINIFINNYASFKGTDSNIKPNSQFQDLENADGKITMYSLYDDILKHKFPAYQIQTFSDMPEYDDFELEYSGYDVVDLIDNNLIEMGDLANGILYDTKNEKRIVFRTINNMIRYVQSRTHYTEEFKTLTKDNPSIIFLYQKFITRNFWGFQISLLPNNETDNQNRADAQVQTPLHFTEFNIDHSYYWNEWDYRRQAIKMVNIRNKETVGCQTAISLFKVNNNTQVWPPVDATTMTGVEDGNNPIWPKNYMVGLRNK